jgi:hypothetical protein
MAPISNARAERDRPGGAHDPARQAAGLVMASNHVAPLTGSLRRKLSGLAALGHACLPPAIFS